MRKYSVEEAIHIGNKVTGFTSFVVGTTVSFVIGIVLVKLFWAWTIPDLFPAAVDQGLIAGNLTWLTATKAVTLVAILGSTGALIARRWGTTARRASGS